MTWYLHKAFRPARLESLVLWLVPSSWRGNKWYNIAPRYTSINHGTIYGAKGDRLIHPSGVFGSALSFDGTDDYVDVGTNLHTDYLTIVAWIKNTAISHQNSVICTDWDGVDMDWQLFGDSVSANSLWFRIDTAEGYDMLGGVTELNFNTWNFVAGTYNGTTMKLYINGELDNSKNHTYGGVIKTTNNKRYIGLQKATGFYPWNGLIDEVRIYNRALSEAEIWHNYTYSPIYYMSRGINPLRLLK